ncbi:MAG: hypothetical protein HUU29_06695, partial [Planctomycetaceae bacterium]|nr:hypothetical protein [Planctomycetaceae bacterium]
RKEEAGQLAEGDRAPTDLKPGLDTSYWRLMSDEVVNLVQQNLPENLTFDDKLLYALNYGVIRDNPDFAWAAKIIKPFLPAAAEHPKYRVVYLHQRLNQVYRKILKVDTLKNMMADLERIKKAIDDAPGERAEAIKHRDHLINEKIDTQADKDKLLKLYAQVDADLEGLKLMEQKNREGGLGGKEDRQRYITLTQNNEKRHEEINHILERNKEIEEIRTADHQADQLLSDLIQLRADKRNKERDMEKEKGAVHNISVSDVKAGLEEEVGKMKGNGRLTARLGKAAQISLPLEERDIMTPEKARAAIAEIEEYDPNLFNNRSTKLKGIPGLLISPGIGEGVYDWEGHNLVIPVMYSRTPLASVASAVVLYRVDVDQSYNDRELILSYKNDIKENKKIRSMIKLRQQLIKDYLLWIVKESKGFPLMEKDNRLWIEYRIAPNKYEPKFPADMRGLTLKQQREGLEAETAKNDDSPMSLFRQALYRYLMESENQEVWNAEVFPRLEKAMQGDPNNLDILYSAGAIYRKAKNKRCIELFVEYTKKAPQSWWSKKALEHVTTFK